MAFDLPTKSAFRLSRSKPEQKVPPRPRNTRTRSSGSSSTSVMISSSRSRIGTVTQFFFHGRFSQTRAT
ncbi:hypothetical protein SALBM311S_03047 [Streptomyces alboniger]